MSVLNDEEIESKKISNNMDCQSVEEDSIKASSSLHKVMTMSERQMIHPYIRWSGKIRSRTRVYSVCKIRLSGERDSNANSKTSRTS